MLFYLFAQLERFLQVYSSLEELENLVDQSMKRSAMVDLIRVDRIVHDWYAYPKHCLPLVPVQRNDREQALEEWRVEQGEVKSHGQAYRVHQDHVFPER